MPRRRGGAGSSASPSPSPSPSQPQPQPQPKSTHKTVSASPLTGAASSALPHAPAVRSNSSQHHSPPATDSSASAARMNTTTTTAASAAATAAAVNAVAAAAAASAAVTTTATSSSSASSSPKGPRGSSGGSSGAGGAAAAAGAVRRSAKGELSAPESSLSTVSVLSPDAPLERTMSFRRATGREWHRAGDPFTREWLFRPHTLLAMLALVLLLLYYAFWTPGQTLQDRVKMGLMSGAIVFLVYCVLQLRDGLILRPHPALWRLATGVLLIYFGVLAFCLQLTRDDAHELVAVVFPEVLIPQPERSYGANCELTPFATVGWPNLRGVLADEFVIAHIGGWYGSMLMIRELKLCLVLSVFFELGEITFQHWLLNFQECWWDHVIVDMLVCNVIGMGLGLLTCRLLSIKTYDWAGESSGKPRSRIRSALEPFTPFSWTNFQWQVFSSPKRLLQVLMIFVAYLAIKTDSFFVKFVLDIPPTSAFNTIRLFVFAAGGAQAFREYYEYVTNPECNRVGPHTWLILAATTLEAIVIIKYSNGMFTAPWPPAVVLSWGAFAVLFVLWAVLFYSCGPCLQSRRRCGMKVVYTIINSLFWLSFVPLAYMFVAECPDLRYGREYATIVMEWLKQAAARSGVAAAVAGVI